MRSGLIARKEGMTRVFTDDGRHVPVTVLTVSDCQVVAVRTEEKDGYTAVQLGAGRAKAKNTTKPMRGHFAAANVEPKRHVVEFRVSPDALIDVGAELSAAHFVQTIEARQGLKIACLEEIALRKGFIDRRQFEKLLDLYGKNDYGQYLRQVLAEHHA